MALHDIPVLPENYPLFDWSDWPRSRAALVSGGPTNQFEMACWNAIVDTLNNALEAASLEWNEFGDLAGDYGYSAEETKIYDGIMRSRCINRVIQNLLNLIPLSMPWSVDPTYPGFIGASVFNERPWSSTPQVVYASYFIGLVERLNKTIEIMRGTGWVSNIRPSNIAVSLLVDNGLYAGCGVNLGQEHHLHLTADITLPACPGAPVQTIDSLILHSSEAVSVRSVKSLPGSSYVLIPLLPQASGAVRPAVRISRHMNSRTKAFSFMELIGSGYAEPSQLKEFSWSTVGAASAKAVYTETQLIASSDSCANLLLRAPQIVRSEAALHCYTSRIGTLKAPSKSIYWQEILTSKTLAEAGASEAVPVELMVLTRTGSVMAELSSLDALPFGRILRTMSTTKATAAKATGHPFSTEYRAYLRRDISVVKSKSHPVWAEKTVSAVVSAQIQPVRVEAIDVEAHSCSGSVCKPGTEKAGEIVGLCLGKVSGNCSLDTAWLPPIWHNGGLWIRQVRSTKRREDGALVISCSGDPIAAVHSARTAAVCCLDTLWLPPVWHNGGLWIRQAHSTKRKEDGSLVISGSNDPISAMYSAKTVAVCSLGTAWLPPVWLDSGLYIRQSTAAFQWENNDLEVK